jgi:hypothetical protein
VGPELGVLASITQNLLLTTGYCSFWPMPPVSLITASNQVNSSKKLSLLCYLITKLTSMVYTDNIIKILLFLENNLEEDLKLAFKIPDLI